MARAAMGGGGEEHEPSLGGCSGTVGARSAHGDGGGTEATGSGSWATGRLRRGHAVVSAARSRLG